MRTVIRRRLNPGFAEGMQYGMIGYFVPHRVYPAGYHCNPRQPVPFASLAAQKHHFALYLMFLYVDSREEQCFRRTWTRTGRPLDMGKCCVRFRRFEDLPLDVIGNAIGRVTVENHIRSYESGRQAAKTASRLPRSRLAPRRLSQRGRSR